MVTSGTGLPEGDHSSAEFAHTFIIRYSATMSILICQMAGSRLGGGRVSRKLRNWRACTSLVDSKRTRLSRARDLRSSSIHLKQALEEMCAGIRLRHLGALVAT